MLSFLILILVIFILWPVIVVGWKVFRQYMMMRRFMKDPMGEMQRQAREQARRRAQQQQQQQNRERREEQRRDAGFGPFGFQWFGSDDYEAPFRSRRRGKRIPDDIGEYVPFREIIISESELKAFFARPVTPFRREEQISDIKWTDI